MQSEGINRPVADSTLDFFSGVLTRCREGWPQLRCEAVRYLSARSIVTILQPGTATSLRETSLDAIREGFEVHVIVEGTRAVNLNR